MFSEIEGVHCADGRRKKTIKERRRHRVRSYSESYLKIEVAHLSRDMADVLNETEILIGYWKSWCSRGIALLFRDNNPVRLTGMQSSHSYKSATGLLSPLLSRLLNDLDLYTFAKRGGAGEISVFKFPSTMLRFFAYHRHWRAGLTDNTAGPIFAQAVWRRSD